MEEKKVCCICGKEFTEWPNNPWPIKQSGECCGECNMNKVVPARILLSLNSKSYDYGLLERKRG